MKLSLGVPGCVAVLLAGSLPAQDYRSYYTVQHPKEFELDWTGFYISRTARTKKVQAKFPHKLDIPYGSDPKERLDVYLPRSPVHRAPVMLFLHGGGFAEGDKAHYGYLAAAYARQGVITVVASYRLTGAGFHYPAQPHDAQQAFAWIHSNIARFGGNPCRIVISGHSAGAILAAELGVRRDWMAQLGIAKTCLRGIVGVSGPYSLVTSEGDYSDYVLDPDSRHAANALLNIDDPVPNVVIAVGGTEAGYVEPSRALDAELRARGVRSTLLVFPTKNHQGTVDALGDDRSELFRDAIAMLRE